MSKIKSIKVFTNVIQSLSSTNHAKPSSVNYENNYKNNIK